MSKEIIVFCRVIGSVFICAWLAIIIKGSSQQERIMSGHENWSMVRRELVELCSATSISRVSVVRAAIKKLKKVVAVHNTFFLLIKKVIGISIIEGMIIFSILIDLGLLVGLYYEYGLLRLLEINLCLLHRLKRLK